MSGEHGYGSTRYGESRYGEGEEPPEGEETRAAQLREQRGPPEPDTPTDAEAFGAGLRLAGAPAETDAEQFPWDLTITDGGSLATTAGVAMLGQDLAFALAAETAPINGQLSPERLADLANSYKNVLERDPRIARLIGQPDVRRGGVDTVRAEVAVIGEDNQRHDLVLPVDASASV